VTYRVARYRNGVANLRYLGRYILCKNDRQCINIETSVFIECMEQFIKERNIGTTNIIA